MWTRLKLQTIRLSWAATPWIQMIGASVMLCASSRRPATTTSSTRWISARRNIDIDARITKVFQSHTLRLYGRQAMLSKKNANDLLAHSGPNDVHASMHALHWLEWPQAVCASWEFNQLQPLLKLWFIRMITYLHQHISELWNSSLHLLANGGFVRAIIRICDVLSNFHSAVNTRPS